MQISKGAGSNICGKQQNEWLRRLGKVAGLNDTKVEIIVSKAAGASMATDELLASIVKTGELLDSEAKDIGLTESLFQFFDENDKLAEAVKKGRFPQLPQGVISRLNDLACFNKEDWLTILENARTDPPRGFSFESYATFLSKKVENLYPSKTMLMMLVIAKATNDLAKMLEALQPLFERNNSLFGHKPFSSLNVSDVDSETQQALRQTHAYLKALANTYSYLRIAEILDDRHLSAENKEKKISARIELLTHFQSQNPDKEFLFLDYSPDSADLQELDFSGFDEDEQRMVLKTIKAFQGIYSVTSRSDHARILLSLGYHSPLQIANTSRKNFISGLGLDETIAMAYYEKAIEMTDKNHFIPDRYQKTKKRL